MKMYNTNIEEQETNINIDYSTRLLNIYTSRKSVILRLSKKLGDPNKIDYIAEAVAGANWIIPFSDKKRIKIALSKTLLIGQMK